MKGTNCALTKVSESGLFSDGNLTWTTLSSSSKLESPLEPVKNNDSHDWYGCKN